MQEISTYIGEYLEYLHIPTVTSITITDVVEIIIITLLIYAMLVWVKETRAWALLKGVLVILAFLLIAAYFQMTTILWIATRLGSLALIAIIVILQPELRKALENLGQTNIISNIFQLDALRTPTTGNFTDKTINEIVKACVEMGKARTGALIVIEHTQRLSEYERTGIDIDAIVSSQLLINIFEHNTPLHDGAVIIRNNRVVAATCYLPLTGRNDLNKDLGTRHRAAVGISEVSDSMTLVVSEENGTISVAQAGVLYRNLDAESLRKQLASLQTRTTDSRRTRKRGGKKNEKKVSK